MHTWLKKTFYMCIWKYVICGFVDNVYMYHPILVFPLLCIINFAYVDCDIKNILILFCYFPPSRFITNKK